MNRTSLRFRLLVGLLAPVALFIVINSVSIYRQALAAATVAYEHHINLDGSGYPRYTYPREAHFASKLVHVCDIYDALCARRPYRDAFRPEQALVIVEDQSGRHLDPDLVHAFSIKPILYGGLACRLLRSPAFVGTVTGLGYLFTGSGWKRR